MVKTDIFSYLEGGITRLTPTQTPDISQKTYKGSMQSSIIDLRLVWARVASNIVPHPKWNTKKHYHAFYELHYVLSGNCSISIDGTCYCLQAKEYLLIPPKHPHMFAEISPDYKEFVVGFYIDFTVSHPDACYIQSALFSLEKNIQIFPSDPAISCYISDIVRYLENSHYFSSAILMNLYLVLLQFSIKAAPAAAGPIRDEGQLIAEVKSFISSNISDGLTTETVALHMNISPRHLNRLVQNRLSKSVNDLIMEEKMNCIRNLLSTTDITLDQVAELSGFTNSYNMSRAFKKQEGMSPGEYRRSLRK
ncbi:MAG: AraC family transcriptional regulator [Eubacteriales bacterium]|nr:AraC family transcriptional regulator [Eubacteriales bacterium]